jgi:hypothetical protein
MYNYQFIRCIIPKRVILQHLFCIILCVDPQYFPNNHSEGEKSKRNTALIVIKLELCIKYPVKIPPTKDYGAPEGE